MAIHTLLTTTDPTVLNTVAANRSTIGARSSNRSTPVRKTLLSRTYLGVFTANAAWLVLAVITFDLTRHHHLAAPTRQRPGRAARRDRAWHVVPDPSRIATSARRMTLHLPQDWPWQSAGPDSTNVSQTHPALPPADHLPTPSARPTPVEHPGSEASHSNTPTHPKPRPHPRTKIDYQANRWIEG